jgi:hypothetical protein
VEAAELAVQLPVALRVKKLTVQCAVTVEGYSCLANQRYWCGPPQVQRSRGGACGAICEEVVRPNQRKVHVPRKKSPGR